MNQNHCVFTVFPVFWRFCELSKSQTGNLKTSGDGSRKLKRLGRLWKHNGFDWFTFKKTGKTVKTQCFGWIFCELSKSQTGNWKTTGDGSPKLKRLGRLWKHSGFEWFNLKKIGKTVKTQCFWTHAPAPTPPNQLEPGFYSLSNDNWTKSSFGWVEAGGARFLFPLQWKLTQI
jgi:hypothetical protein